MADDATQNADDELPPQAEAEGAEDAQADSETPEANDLEEEGISTPPPTHLIQRQHHKKARKGLMWSGTGLVLTALAFLVVVIALSLMGRSLELPDWAVDRLEARINAELPKERIQFSSVSFGLLDSAYRPTVDVTQVELFNADGQLILALPKLRTKLDTSELLLGRLKLETLEVEGASIDLIRDKDGKIALAFGAQVGGDQVQAGSMAEVLTQIDTWLAEPWMEELEEVKAGELSIKLTDARSGEVTSVERGVLNLTNAPKAIALTVSIDLDQPAGPPARLFFSADKTKGEAGAKLVGKFTNLRARDLASQVGALNFLSILDAPVSGALSADIDPEGQVAGLAGTLDIAQGHLRPTEQAKPVPFNSAKTYLRYEAATGRLLFDQITLDAPELRLDATGHADLSDFKAGVPQVLLGQLRFSNVRLAPEGLFEAPVTFSTGELDMRYRPAELQLDIGQLTLRSDGVNLRAFGAVDVLPTGWSVSLDAAIDNISHDRVMSLWPENAVKKTRHWLVENIREGQAEHVHASLRIVPDEPLKAAVSFDFSGTKVKFLKTLPPVEGARGYASISEKTFNLSLQEGYVTAPVGGALQAAGSVMEIPDMRAKPAMGVFDLTLNGPLSATLSLLDEKPFEFLTKSDLKTDVATGVAKINTRLTVPLKEKVKIKDVGYVVSAEVRGVASDTLIEGHKLRADLMEVLAGDGQLSIGGKATIDKLPMDVLWARKIGAGTGKNSTVSGTIELSPRTLSVFNVGLPKGSVTGSGRGNIDIKLAKGAAPEVTLNSNLRGIGLAIPALSWVKPKSSKGSLKLDLTLGATPKVNDVQINAGGLKARGTVTLNPGGGLKNAVFKSFKIAGKLNSRVDLIGRGVNRSPLVSIKGGTIDIRKFGVTSNGGSGASAGPPLELALDRLIVADSIALDQFKGSFRNKKGIDGTFKANLNGKAAITGTVIPTGQGPAVRIKSSNGGRVIAASGIFLNANGGDMTLTLQPNGKAGQFEGSLKIKNTRVKKAPALADLLSALSVIGLLEQLTGEGILFTNTQARFLLTPGGVTLKSSSAVGPSMGITMDGIYNTGSRRMDMRGVVSPIYAVNGLFGALFSPRRGEGLFGFNYTLKGSVDGPRVGVNPLSILTPGIFREIFRQAPPKLKN